MNVMKITNNNTLQYVISILLLFFLILRSTLFKSTNYDIIYYSLITIINLFYFYYCLTYNTKIGIKTLFLIVICTLSLFINYLVGNVNPILNSWPRLISFIFAINIIGPLLINTKTIKFRNILFITCIYSILIIFIINIGLVIKMDAINFEGYNGNLESQLLLGALASLSIITFTVLFIYTKSLFYKFIYLISFIISFPVLLLSASRSAILSLIISLCFYFIFNLKKSLPIISFLFLFTLLTFDKLQIYSNVLIEKIDKRNNSGDITAGRSGIYYDNFLDFKANPLFGSGFYNLINVSNSKINNDGSLEYSSSWLFILSSTGILGLFYFLHLIYKSIITSVKMNYNKIDKYDTIACLYMIFFIVHSNFEGYIFSAGGLLFFTFWITYSKITTIKFNENTANFVRG